MQKVLATLPEKHYNNRMTANTTTTATVISKGQTAGGFTYEIKHHLKGHKNQYFVLRGMYESKGCLFTHNSQSLSYLKKILERY